MLILNKIALIIGVIGVVVIIWGVFMSVVEFIKLEIAKFYRVDICKSREALRHHFGSYLLIGLEFLTQDSICGSDFNSDFSVDILDIVLIVSNILGE